MIRRSGRPIEGSAVQEDRNLGARLRQRVGHVALFVALAVVPVLALNSLATADTGTDPTAAPTPPAAGPRSPTRSASASPTRASPSRPAAPTAPSPSSRANSAVSSGKRAQRVASAR